MGIGTEQMFTLWHKTLNKCLYMSTNHSGSVTAEINVIYNSLLKLSADVRDSVIYIHVYFMFIRSHMNMGTYIFLIGLKPPPRSGYKIVNLCPKPSPLNFAEIPMIFCTALRDHTFWVVPECSVKFWPKCSSFCKMAAILRPKKSHFCTFLPVYFGYSNETWQGHC